MTDRPEINPAAAAHPAASAAVARMMADLGRICDCGGRLTGTESERRAVALLRSLGAEATGVEAEVDRFPYDGWLSAGAELTLEDGTVAPCHPLVRSLASPGAGVAAEVLDLGRGTMEDFDAAVAEIPGRIVLVRHEVMFSPDTVHRRLKYARAVAEGAAGFLIAGPLGGSLVAGSSGRDGGDRGIPAVGISPETAGRLAPALGRRARVRLAVRASEGPATAENLIFDIPGQTEDRIVVSAHIDGHDLAESAIDNATGLAMALELARGVRELPKPPLRGMRLMFFNAEEWALTGSALHVSGLSPAARDRIGLVLNIDSVGCGAQLAALTSGFAGLEPFLAAACARSSVPVKMFRPLQRNSDHANFAEAGIPAFRLVDGFGEAGAAARKVLTEYDRRDAVDPARLHDALAFAREVLAAALTAPPDVARSWRQG